MGPGWLFTPSIDRVGPRSVLRAAMTSVCEDHVTQCCRWIISEPRTYLYITGGSDISPVSQGADAEINAKRALWWTLQLPESRHQGAQTSESQFFTGWSLPSPLPPPPQSFVMILITSGSSAAAPYPPPMILPESCRQSRLWVNVLILEFGIDYIRYFILLWYSKTKQNGLQPSLIEY